MQAAWLTWAALDEIREQTQVALQRLEDVATTADDDEAIGYSYAIGQMKRAVEAVVGLPGANPPETPGDHQAASEARALLGSDHGTAQAILDLIRHIDQRRRLTREHQPDET